jgi:hypothetical protein
VDHLLETHLGAGKHEGQPEGVALDTRSFLAELSHGVARAKRR